MADPVTDVKMTVADARSTALAAVNKQESWVRTNAKPLIMGFVLGLLLAAGLHFVL